MPIKTLRPKKYTVVPTRVPWGGRLNYFVESERPVYTFVMDDDELDKFDKGEKTTYYGGRDEIRVHKVRTKLAYGGKWNVVILNYTKEPTAVYYEVS